MAVRSEKELLDSALEFREMAAAGGDVGLLEALLLVAKEFEEEAARLLGSAGGVDEPA